MSDFYAGILFLSRQANVVEETLKNAGINIALQPVNDKWSTLLMQGEWLGSEETTAQLMELSKAVPLLYFFDAEDHGWAYRIFEQGDVVASFEVDYDLTTQIAYDIADTKYPDADIDSNPKIWAALLKEAARSKEYRQWVEAEVQKSHVECFTRFDVDADGVQALAELLSFQSFSTAESTLGPVNRFKSIIELSGLIKGRLQYMSDEV